MNKLMSRLDYEKDEKARGNVDGALVFDGDGDGASAAAMYMRYNPGVYVGFTNTQKGQRDLAKYVSDTFSPTELASMKRVAVFDISAEQNMPALEEIASSVETLDFVDHHTKMPLPGRINNHSKPDSPEVCSSSILYDYLKDKLSQPELTEATRLAILGLSNDGKDHYAKKLGQGILPKEEIDHILNCGHALNYIANKGNEIDFIGVARELAYSPQKYLSSFELKYLMELRKQAISQLKSGAHTLTSGNLEVLVFPHTTEEEIELSRSAYPEILNERSSNNPDRILVGIIYLPDGKSRVAMRGRNILPLAEKVAPHYDSKALGRETAAGFDTSREVESSDLLTKLNST